MKRNRGPALMKALTGSGAESIANGVKVESARISCRSSSEQLGRVTTEARAVNSLGVEWGVSDDPERGVIYDSSVAPFAQNSRGFPTSVER